MLRFRARKLSYLLSRCGWICLIVAIWASGVQASSAAQHSQTIRSVLTIFSNSRRRVCHSFIQPSGTPALPVFSLASSHRFSSFVLRLFFSALPTTAFHPIGRPPAHPTHGNSEGGQNLLRVCVAFRGAGVDIWSPPPPWTTPLRSRSCRRHL